MQVTYAGITFELTKVNSYDMQPVRSPDGLDYLWTRVRIDVEGVLNPDAMAFENISGLAIPSQGTLPATTIAAIRHQLLQPRGLLQVTDYEDQVVLFSPAPGFACDCDGGPFPISADIRVLGGSRTMYLRFVVETFTRDCPLGADSALVSLSWQDEHHLNQNHLTTRVQGGTAVFRRDWLDAQGRVADDFRNILLPPVAPGFQRKAINVLVESHGNRLQYQVIDEERIWDLGESDPRQGGTGILRIDGTYGVSTMQTPEGPPAGQSMAVIDLKAWGGKRANQWVLLQTLIRIAATKVQIGNAARGFLQHVSMRESMGQDEKWVELQIAFRQNPPPNAVLANIPIDALRQDVATLFTDQQGVNPAFPDRGRGTAAVKVVTKALQIACFSVAAPQPSGIAPATGPDRPYGPPPAINVQGADTLPQTTPKYKDPGYIPYTRSGINLQIDRDTGLKPAPATGSASGSSGSAGGGTPAASKDWGGATGSFRGPSGGSTPPSPAPAVRLFRFYWPIEKMRATWSAERVGAPPLIPSPTLGDSAWVLLHAAIDLAAPIVWNDGVSIVYAASGVYEYVRQVALQPGQPLPMGALPWTALRFVDNLLPSDFFQHGMLDNEEGGGSGSGSQTAGLDT